MKAASILVGWAVPLWLLSVHVVSFVSAVEALRRAGDERSPGAAPAQKSRALAMKSMKGCNAAARGKGMKARRCPRRRPSAPTKRPTRAPTAPPSEDVLCLTYQTDPTGLTNHLYGVGYTKLGLTWTEARAEVAGMKSCCGGVRPHLVSITSAEENALVLSLFAGIGLTQGDSAYLGLTNRNQPGFVWDGTTAEPFGYQNWCTPANGNCLSTEPDNGPNACAAMLLTDVGVTPGVWFDYTCDLAAPNFYVFEYDCAAER